MPQATLSILLFLLFYILKLYHFMSSFMVLKIRCHEFYFSMYYIVYCLTEVYRAFLDMQDCGSSVIYLFG